MRWNEYIRMLNDDEISELAEENYIGPLIFKEITYGIEHLMEERNDRARWNVLEQYKMLGEFWAEMFNKW